jgi:large conductance mechanosensitive channel
VLNEKSKKMSVIKEFRDFAMRGNIVDMAVGIIIGTAFAKIVSSIVNDVLMPPLGMILGRIDFKDFKIILQNAVPAVTVNGQVIKEALAEVSIKYGMFIQTIIDFTIVAICIFMVIKLMNRLKKKEAAAPVAPAAPTKEEVLLTEIRDLLKEKK